MSNHFQFLVLGGGSAGYAAAFNARAVCASVAVIDGSEELGGLCILRGCMPSKTLLYSAEVLHLAQRADAFGLCVPEAKVDMQALQKRKREKIAEFADYRREQLESDRFTLFRQCGKFVDAHTVELDDGRRLTADKILVATGSVVNYPPIPGLRETPHWTSDDVLNLDYVPESVIVLGAGAVACELAQFLNRIGAEVTLIQRSAHILSESSPHAASVVEDVLRRECFDLYTDTQVQRVEQTDNGVRVTFGCKGEEKTVEARHLFNALGRKPAVDGLGLEAAGVALSPSGHIQTNDHQQTSAPHIYAAGDVAGPVEIVHVAILQGELAAQHATGREAKPVCYDHLTSVIFTDPQVGFVGIPEHELDKRGVAYVKADYPFDDHGKSITMDATDGYVKIWAEKASGTVLAAECVHKDASELIHSMAIAVATGLTVHDLLKAHWYHPTLSEIWTYPLEDCRDALTQ